MDFIFFLFFNNLMVQLCLTPFVLNMRYIYRCGNYNKIIKKLLHVRHTEITNAVQCQENTFHANCPIGQVLNVTSADLGRSQGWDVCPQELVFSNSDLPCSHSQSLDIMQTACNGENECKMVVNFDDFGYPCSQPDMVLYLNVSYSCVGESQKSKMYRRKKKS